MTAIGTNAVSYLGYAMILHYKGIYPDVLCMRIYPDVMLSLLGIYPDVLCMSIYPDVMLLCIAHKGLLHMIASSL